METAGIRGDAASMKADEILKDIESFGTQMADLAAERARVRADDSVMDEQLDGKIRKLRDAFKARDNQLRLIPK